MSTLNFTELMLVSFREKKARRVRFDEKVTVLHGTNETGKSSLIKSIFRTLGAEPAKVNSRWKDADARSLLRFTCESGEYTLLRVGESYSIFDSRGRLLRRCKSVSNELGPFLAGLFNFKLQLQSRDGVFSPLPPAYYFLPFYMDQDSSWVKAWSSFANLGQFANWRKGVVEYHAGIRGNAYYESQSNRLNAEQELARGRRKREGLQAIYDDLQDRFEIGQFNVDFSAYQSEIEELLARCEELRLREERYKAELAEMYNQRGELQAQLRITQQAREESHEDYEHAHKSEGEEIECPTCGAGYTNSFAERFAIAVDEDRCANLALKISEELDAVDDRIREGKERARRLEAERASHEKLLSRKEGELELTDLIRQEGRRELRQVMSTDLEAMIVAEGELSSRIYDAQQQMKKLESRDRRKAVNDFFHTKMGTFLQMLDVHSVPEKEYSNVYATIKDTGSELPRALLAQQVAFLHTIKEFGAQSFAPIVIDSPYQQEQDEDHKKRILRFLRDQLPSDSQLILALVEAPGEGLPGKHIETTEKYCILNEGSFDEVSEEVTHYIDATLNA